MISGFPSDFPCPPKAQIIKEIAVDSISGGGVFVRSELSDAADIPISPAQKRPKIDLEAENIETSQNNRVKFCVEPPKEFLMFPDCEYDRTSIHKSAGKWSKYTTTQGHFT